MGIGAASGPNRALEAARKAIHSSLLEVTIDGATSAIVNFTASESLAAREIEVALAEIRNNCDKDLDIIYGTAYNNELGDEMIVTVVATGYELKAKSFGYSEIANEIYKNMSEQNIDYTSIKASYEEEEEEIPVNESEKKVEEVFDIKRSRREEKLRLKEEKRQKKLEAKEQKEEKDEPVENRDLPSWLRK